MFGKKHDKTTKDYPQMNDSQIFQHIIKYKLPLWIQGFHWWHWPQLQDLLTMVHEYAMPHFFLTLIANEMTQSQWHEFNDMECLVK